MCLWQYDAGIAWKRDCHEILKKDHVEFPLEALGNHGD